MDAGENYCTIGIENQTQTDGVKVTYANLYTPASATITAGVALKFTPDIAYGSGMPQVSVALAPFGAPIILPSTGGSFDYNIAVANNDTMTLSFDVWCNVTLPSGSTFGPVLGPVQVIFPSGYGTDRDRTQTVPGNAPAGTYNYNAYAGAYPAAIWDSASFIFTKAAVGLGALGGSWFNSGELFDGETPVAIADLPVYFALSGISPNPFNPVTTISYQLAALSHVRLEIFDLAGRNVAEVVNEVQTAGVHQATWDAAGFPSGIYFCRLEAGNFRQMQKLILLK